MENRPKALRRKVSSGYYLSEEGPLVETSIFPLSFLVVQDPVYLSHVKYRWIFWAKAEASLHCLHFILNFKRSSISFICRAI